MTGTKIPLEIIRFFRWKITKERILPRNMPKIPLFVIGLLQLAITWYKNRPSWRARSLLFPHWDIKTKRPEPVKLDLPLFWCPSAGIIMSLPSSNGDFVPPDR